MYRLWLLFVCFFSYFLISSMAALLIRFAVRCAVVLIFPCIACESMNASEPRDIRRMYARRHHFYIGMGMIGAEAAYRDRNNMGKCAMICSIILAIILIYVAHVACYSIWNALIFSAAFSGRLNEQYYLYVNFSELMSFLFIRTRSSIKYMPKMITILNMVFLMYVNTYMYCAG